MTSTKKFSRRQVIAGAVGAGVVAAGGGAYYSFLAPSGDVHEYAGHLVNDQRALRSGEVRVTFLGATTLLVDDGTTQLLFDAFITDISLRTAVFGELSTDEAKVDATLARVGADRIEAMFTTHSHYDHALDVAHIARRTGAILHGSPSTLNIGRGGDLPEAQLQAYQVDQPVKAGAFTVTALASKHSPGTKGGDGTPITGPLRQPARAGDFYEGGSYDLLVEHGGHSLLVKGSAGYRPGALDNVRADAMFCATAGSMGKDASFREQFYEQTIAKVQPKLFVPLHWNDFFHPVTGDLAANMKAIDDVTAGWNYLIDKFESSHCEFAPMEGYSSVILFGSTGRAA
ncbi:hypothetical protein GCM10010435_41590 [Winogradskya consettensis]|uniref:Metallo-beta-lactamase domain-containing protein n=1 Tax=Winogradskya consettensis TaxID=113560 RepID=A0A919VU76_9ACTN|nr:MBL fold metallo-hydrolase [Actinoplanes consettensis]GIM76811.1 hypothetical protein Aco04nite_52290 [Actinoplanes consettensis]